MNIDLIQALAKILKDNQLSELTYQNGNRKLKLKQQLEKSIGRPEPPVSIENTSPQDEQKVITAPTIGTFYTSKSPSDPPFVSVGDHIEVGDTIGIIEAMKVMNEIKADKAGIIKEILVTNGQGVEFDEPIIQLA
ncbi:acetyl-CoA carboxylase biotin carboxyl carrier protein subunit [Lentilactobacillus fungorum]|uniref:Biotin carboxyl carrier protein of acetyl-CoA carboxylase n=1 Tax=Lentilactobacillus fungorum TaxID=2201250 RepID=A0ABQ3VXZ1_9LACO|nr:biotin/lipoyl-containing protein [Lentilactobacillus fungorum]GHP13425.1 acetyl-CoA carboxylase biotin carboxyl carrier protein subunit [Lentilactobacillus fungorum]